MYKVLERESYRFEDDMMEMFERIDDLNERDDDYEGEPDARAEFGQKFEHTAPALGHMMSVVELPILPNSARGYGSAQRCTTVPIRKVGYHGGL